MTDEHSDPLAMPPQPLPVTFSALRKILTAGSPGEKFQAAKLLASAALCDPSPAHEAGRDPDAAIRESAAWALGQARCSDDVSVALLCQLLQDANLSVQRKAAHALRLLPPSPEIQKALAECADAVNLGANNPG